LVSGKMVEVMGAKLPDAAWGKIIGEIDKF
jgi:hypothetical protein